MLLSTMCLISCRPTDRPMPRLTTCLSLLGLVLAASTARSQAVYTCTSAHTFDTGVVTTGTSSSLPTGGPFSEAGPSANPTYSTGNGSSDVGDTYSFGATGLPERAFGSLRSTFLLPVIGVQVQNGTGSALDAITVS